MFENMRDCLIISCENPHTSQNDKRDCRKRCEKYYYGDKHTDIHSAVYLAYSH